MNGADDDSPPPATGFFRRLAIWTVVCTVSAVPSFYAARGTYDVAGMVCGVILFILGYTVATGTETVRRLKSRPFVRGSMYFAYGARILVSIYLPLGIVVDLYPGFVSTAITDLLFADPEAFSGTLLTTVLQGILLNLILGVIMGLAYVVQVAFRSRPIPEGFCRMCGYNLTGNVSGRCSECGEPIATCVDDAGAGDSRNHETR